MCYCGLTQASGAYLGQILSTTAMKELFLDGNDLRCYGCQDLIRVVAQEAEKMAMQRLMEKRLKAEEKERLREEGVFEPEEEKKKKKKKGGSKLIFWPCFFLIGIIESIYLKICSEIRR